MTGDYQQLLERDEWKLRRQTILNRANHTCSECGRSDSGGIILHVHHRYYRLGLLPWEYPDSALVVLCEEHHELLHRTTKITVFDESGQPFAQSASCSKCSGAGYLPPYNHICAGICFRCGGTGIDPEKIVVGQTQSQLDAGAL